LRGRLLLVALTAAGVWEGWRWYWLRIAPAPEESLTLIAALIFAGWILIARKARPREAAHAFASIPLIAGLLIAYAVSWVFAPPIVASALAVAATSASVIVAATGRPPSMALGALIIGSMPVLPSLQFTLGYPMRLASASLAEGALEMQGLSVARHGTFLLWQGQEIQFDAPCSGVNMLWAGLLFTCLIAAAVQCSPRRFIAAVCACIGIVLIFNVLRAVSIFYLEAVAGEPMESWKHSGVGLISFAMALPLLALTVKPGQRIGPAQEHRVCRKPFLKLSLAAFIAAAGPVIAKETQFPQASVSQEAPAWPTQFEGKLLAVLPLTDKERAFAQGFPGQIARFSDGESEIIIRWVKEATRLLHPASDCFKGLGYSISVLPLKRASDGTVMGCFIASRDGVRLQVCEQVRNDKGQVWADASSWYWAAFWGGVQTPSWSYVVAKPLNP
jgi:exosortase/archaeosortase family protein